MLRAENSTIHDVSEGAKAIYTHFISRAAEEQINISAKQTQGLEEALNKLTVFAEEQFDITARQTQELLLDLLLFLMILLLIVLFLLYLLFC